MMPAFGVLAELLGQMIEVLRQLPDEDYHAPGPEGISGSVGQHVRHCLEHVHALEHGVRHHQVDYDTRGRGSSIERSRRLALAALESARARLHALDDRWLAKVVELDVQLFPEGQRLSVRSTIGREVAFVISHTIHHNATINLLLQHRTFERPRGFGYAVSTPCALSA